MLPVRSPLPSNVPSTRSAPASTPSSDLPGFVSANLHVSLDRKHVANYAQWKTRADFEAMLKNPVARGHMTQAAAIATSFTPTLYELRHVHAGAP
jgi:hypothetical protein